MLMRFRPKMPQIRTLASQERKMQCFYIFTFIPWNCIFLYWRVANGWQSKLLTSYHYKIL